MILKFICLYNVICLHNTAYIIWGDERTWGVISNEELEDVISRQHRNCYSGEAHIISALCQGRIDNRVVMANHNWMYRMTTRYSHQLAWPHFNVREVAPSSVVRFSLNQHQYFANILK